MTTTTAVKVDEEQATRLAYIRKMQGHADPPAPDSPFDPRTQVSADAKYIVRNLVIWLLVIPSVLGVAIWALTR